LGSAARRLGQDATGQARHDLERRERGTEEGTPVRDVGSISYSAAIESAARQVVLGDRARYLEPR